MIQRLAIQWDQKMPKKVTLMTPMMRWTMMRRKTTKVRKSGFFFFFLFFFFFWTFLKLFLNFFCRRRRYTSRFRRNRSCVQKSPSRWRNPFRTHAGITRFTKYSFTIYYRFRKKSWIQLIDGRLSTSIYDLVLINVCHFHHQ